MESTVVPRIGMPARSSAGASLSGVWPPNWTIVPFKVPAEASTAMSSSTSSAVSGSKYNRSDVS